MRKDPFFSPTIKRDPLLNISSFFGLFLVLEMLDQLFPPRDEEFEFLPAQHSQILAAFFDFGGGGLVVERD